MTRKICIGISVLAATFYASSAIAEDAVKADPKHYTVKFEDDKIRIEQPETVTRVVQLTT